MYDRFVNKIHPSATIGPGVYLGENNIVGPNSVIFGPLGIGDNNWIGPNVVIGTPPQFRGSEHTASWEINESVNGISIGSRNIIREFVSIERPTRKVTSIGDDCFLMAQTHICHDSKIGNMVTLANSTQVAGHCVIQDFATCGLSVSIHQRSIIGYGAMIGMGSVVTKNIPPLALSFGNPSKLRGANRIGMQRLGYNNEEIEAVENIIENNLYKPGEICDLAFYRDLLRCWFDDSNNLTI